KFFEAGVTAALAHARPQERADAACNLSLLKCPQRRPPALHHVAERFYPFGRTRFPPPHVHEVKPKLTILPQHYMHGVISAFLVAHREVRSTIQPQPRRPCDKLRRLLSQPSTHCRPRRVLARFLASRSNLRNDCIVALFSLSPRKRHESV